MILWRAQPLKRPKHIGPPCTFPKGCPKGHIDDQHVLSAKNQRAYEYYQQCRAIGRFPEDWIVEHNAGIIYQVEQGIDRVSTTQISHLVAAMVSR